MAPKQPRAALYARVSTQDQDVLVQVDELRSEATRRGWRVQSIYSDEGVSGSDTARPELDRLLADVRAGRVDLVAVWKLDRLGRSMQHLMKLLVEFREAEVAFVSLRDAGLDTTTASGTLFTQILAAFAEYERNIIVERTRAGLARARRRGKTLGRPRKEMDLRAAHLLLEQGHSVRQTAEMLSVPRGTLRRRLAEAKARVRAGGPETPLSAEAGRGD